MTTGYETPAAFRRALTDKLKALAKESQWNVQRLQRQYAYDRLLERLYLMDQGWIVKGAVALIARGIGVRGSIDIDLVRDQGAEVAEAQLRGAAARDIGDWFRFEIAVRRSELSAVDGVRLPVVAYIGNTEWQRFHVDLVASDLRMVGEPDAVDALALVEITGAEQNGYRAFPLVDHVADQITATFELYGEDKVPSTRYRDLVDLVAIARGGSVQATPQMEALRSEALRRGITLPEKFAVPARDDWERGDAREAGKSVLTSALTLDKALDVVGPFVDPLLTDTAMGRWDHERGAWLAD